MPDELRPLNALKPESTASAKDKHDYLVALLKESRYGMIDFMFKQAAVLTLLIGWIVSSDKARDFIADNPMVRNMGAGVVAFYSFLFVFWAWTYRNRSASAHEHLLKLAYMPADFYSTLLITRQLATSLVGIHVVGCGVLIAFIFHVR